VAADIGATGRGLAGSWFNSQTGPAAVGERDRGHQPADLLGRGFAALLIDWDGTAVADRVHDASAVRAKVEELCGLGIHLAVVSGTHLENIDSQLHARPRGPGALHLALNRGSELYEVAEDGPRLLTRREESAAEHAALDHVAAAVIGELGRRSLQAALVGDRPNRRKIDLLPEEGGGAAPAKSRIADTLARSRRRVHDAGLQSLGEVADLCRERWPRDLPPLCLTTDAKHVELGLTDKGDSMRALLRVWADLGVGPGLVLAVGDEFGRLDDLPGSDARMMVPEARRTTFVSVGVEPAGVPPRVHHLGGGPSTLALLLDEQVVWSRTRVPELDPDPDWTLMDRGQDAARSRVTQSLMSLASGRVCTRGVDETRSVADAAVRVAGIYEGPGAEDGLLTNGSWTALLDDDATRAPSVRVLDMRTGVIRRHLGHAGSREEERSARFASADDPGVVALRLEAPAEHLTPVEASSWSSSSDRDGGIGTSLRTATWSLGGGRVATERLGVVSGASGEVPDRREAERRLDAAARRGFGVLLCEHRAEWGRRWASGGIALPSDLPMQRALRFALFHLWSLAGCGVELGLGARGATGPAYSGHVFWDADVHVLPAVMTLDPAVAEAMVRYRVARLDAARDEALALGRPGARFPWESGLTGHDVTPEWGRLGGRPVAIRTGSLEEHITADVAWAVVRQAVWSRPGGRLTREESILLADTARYWAVRAERHADGRWHIDHVIGPDEYHEDVADNAFTNVMARWNLRTAAQRCALVSTRTERRRWLQIADGLVDGFDAATSRYEQFRGYFDLEPVTADELGRTPVAADLLLGPDQVARSQIVKQPDVLMLHHLVPELLAPGSLAADVDWYVPRTAHGSSLSLGITAAVLARAGRAEKALELLRSAVAIDLDDIGDTTAAGLHLAALGSTWQAVLHGFLGADVASNDVLTLDPHLPHTWTDMEVRFACLGTHVHVQIRDERLRVRSGSPLDVKVGVEAPVRTTPGTAQIWEVTRDG
jgi:trehalose/maltose hydrolase-like predicted phosphorylase